MDKITKNKNNSKNVSKVLSKIENNKNLSKIKRYKNGDELIYNDCRYIVHNYYDLGKKGLFYELIDEITFKRLEKENRESEIKNNLYGVDQRSIIEYEFEQRLGYEVVALKDSQNCYDFKTDTTLKSYNKDSYETKEKKLKGYELNKQDYKIGFLYDISGYDYWKEYNFDNLIQINFEIKNYQFNIADLTTDLRNIINKVETIDYSFE